MNTPAIEPGQLVEPQTFACAPSFAQQRLWFMNQLDPETSAYNVALTFRVTGPLDAEILEQALAAVVDRHEALRTTFEVIDSELIQLVHHHAVTILHVRDLQHIPADQREAVAQEALTAETRKPFDLLHGPLFRAVLWKLAPGEHVLMLNMHHIVSDGWSFNILRTEMGAHYESLVTGRPAQVPELTIQVADYAEWQRQWLQGDVLDRQFQYWKSKIGDLAPVLNVPTDYPRPSVRSSNGSVMRLVIPVATVQGIKALSESAGCTTYMAYLAAFKVLLHRFTGQTDIWVGSPVAGRTQEETENLIGCFINTLVLRTDLAGAPTFLQMLDQVRDVVVDAFANQEMPFEVLVDKLDVVRDRSRNPLFQAMIIDSSNFVQPLEVAGLKFTPLLIERGASMVDLTLFLVGSGEGLKVGLEYSTDLFTEETADRLLNTYLNLLAGIVSDPSQTIDALPLLTSGEQEKLLIDWNDTDADYPTDKQVHQLVEAQAARTPNAVAATCAGELLTYAELDRRAEELALHLTHLGVQPDTRVGLFVERSLDMVVGILGISKAGGAYVPLDPDYPAKRIEYILQDAQAPVLVTQQRLADRLPEHNAEILLIDQLPEEPRASLQPSAFSHQPSDLAYVIYTSGSTGNPKGVQISHRALINLLCSMQKTPGLSKDDTLAAVTTLCFDIAGLELWLPLITGAKILIVERDTTVDGEKLAALLKSEHVSIMQATPATWRLMLDSGWHGKADLKILCGGEALPPSLAEALIPKCRSLWNVYGPTETTIWSTVLKVENTDRTLTIGRPIDNTQIYILDARNQPTPIGVPGELYIGGHGLARGYLNRPELTAEKFVPNPFADTSASPELGAGGARTGTAGAGSPSNPTHNRRLLYRTGDLARYRADGEIEFLGRLDHQVKIRGFRIELGEIESRLRTHSSVRQALVVAREDTPGDKRLVAYLVPQPGETADWSEVRSAIKETLPDYMLPSACVWLEAMPQTANGKIDQKALPAPERDRPAASETSDRPPTGTEAKLIKIWESVLRVSPVGVRDDFFELGGHSLVAVRLFAEIERAFSTRLPLSTLFQASTVESLAEQLDGPQIEDAWSTLVPINTRGTLPPFFCVHAVGANVLNYRLLSKYLGDDQPFYGFQAQGLDGTMAALDTVEEMASQYLAEVRRIQPRGPYYIGGASWGGTVAFEMGRQLAAQGDEVALVALLDTMLMGHQVPERLGPRSVSHFRLRLIDRHLGKFCDLPVKDQVQFVLGSLANKIRQKLPGWTGGRPQQQTVSIEESIDSLKDTIVGAMRRHKPGPYNGRVAMFLADDAPDRTRLDLRLLWGEYALSGLEVYSVPGEHGDFLDEPHVEVVAERLRQCLERVVEIETLRADAARAPKRYRAVA